MRVVTLTSDFGRSDYYAGALKGAILRLADPVQLIDISHHIRQNDLLHGAFVLRNAYREFPEGSIHILSVGNYHGEHKNFVAMEHGGHYFIGPNNGMFSLLFDELPGGVYELEAISAGTFHFKELFAQSVAKLVQGQPISSLGPVCNTVERRLALQPVTGPSEIRATVQYIDHYDNVELNVHQFLFEQVGKGRPFSLHFKRMEPINRLSWQYYDVPVGEPLCLFNSAGFLEVAVHMGRAATLLGMRLDDGIQIRFDEH
jgi:S-adenosylmethionine hydrolase